MAFDAPVYGVKLSSPNFRAVKAERASTSRHTVGGSEAQHEFSSKGSERPTIGYDEGFQKISSRLDAGRSRGQETGNAALGVPESHG